MPHSKKSAAGKKTATRPQEPGPQEVKQQNARRKDGLTGQGAESALVQLRALEKKRVPRRDGTE
jgi:hypothetical protein